jgi:hypothetical protein
MLGKPGWGGPGAPGEQGIRGRMAGMTRGFVLGVAVGLLAGAIAFVTWPRGAPGSDSEQAPRTAVGTAPASETAPHLVGSPLGTSRLKEQLEVAEARIGQLIQELEAARRPAPAPVAPSPFEADALPALAREHAAKRKVSDRVLDLLWRARNRYYGADAATREEVVAPLRAHGEEVVLGVAALNQSGGGHIDLPMIVAELRLPRGGELLIRMMEEDKHLGSLVRALPSYDSPQVRAYLLERIARETDPGAFWNLAESLGDLREPRGAEVIRIQQFLAPTWRGVRGHVLHAIGRMGGPAAVRLLDDYLQLPNVDHLGAAVAALATLDRERARSHALRIKQSDRYPFLDMMDRIEVDRLTADEAGGARKLSGS